MGFKGWKKISTSKTHSVLENNDGHQLTIAHAPLSPKLRGHLAEIPIHKEDNANGKRAVQDNKGQLKMADGGAVSKEDQKKSIEAAINGKRPTGGENVHNLGGGATVTKASPDPDGDAIARMQKENVADPSKADALAKTNAARANYKAPFAKGGVVKMADGGMPEDQPAADELVPGVPQTASNPQAYDFEQKKAAIAQSDMNYATPQQANIGITTKALDQLDNEKAAGAQAAAKVGAEQGAAYQQAVDLNKRLAAAGLPQNPLPQAPATPPAAGGMDQPSDAQQGGLGMAQGDGAAPDPYGTRATASTYMQGIGEEKAGLAGEAKALGAQGQAEAKVAHDNAVNQASLLDDYHNQMGVLNKERGEFQKAVSDAKIDPNHYLGSMSTMDRIGTAIGFILGGMGAGLTGGENPAMKMLNLQIDRDIDAQKATLGKQKSLLEYNLQQTGNLNAATNMTKAMLNDITSMKLKETAAKSMDPLAKARALQAAGTIDQQSAAIIGQNAMRTSMLTGMKNGKVAPASVVEMAIPAESRPAARKELKDMQDAIQLRDHVMSAFDQLNKINTIGNRITSPIQTPRQVEAILGPVLDKVTKDTSGRVTPETVNLIKKAFGGMGNSPETQMKARASLQSLMSQGMNYPTLSAFGITPDGMGRSKLQETKPVPNKKK